MKEENGEIIYEVGDEVVRAELGPEGVELVQGRVVKAGEVRAWIEYGIDPEKPIKTHVRQSVVQDFAEWNISKREATKALLSRCVANRKRKEKEFLEACGDALAVSKFWDFNFAD